MTPDNPSDKPSGGLGRWVIVFLLVLSSIGAVALVSGFFGPSNSGTAPVAEPSTRVPSLETSTTFQGTAGPWATLPEAPIEWRTANSAVWTGEEFITWGATAGSTDRLAFDGAAYSPSSNEWHVLPDPGLATWVGYEQVWTDEELVIWGTSESGLGGETGLAYDPVANTWREVASNPDFSVIDTVWTGEEILVLGQSGEPEYSTLLASYHPENDSWDNLAPPPQDLGIFQLTAWANGRLLAWADDAVDDQFDNRIARGLAYNPRADAWEELPRAPLAGRWGHTAVWTGSEVLMFGGTGESGEVRDGAAYDPAAGTWRTIPDVPLAPSFNQIAVWSGADVLVWGGQAQIAEGAGFITYSDGAAYNPEFDSWRPLATAPVKVKGDTYSASGDDAGGMIIWGTSGGFHFNPERVVREAS
jgi:hypothetical protein